MTMSPRNPPWAREELILALKLYLERWHTGISVDDPDVKELSQVLNSLPVHSYRPDAPRFRNTNGVYMKLGNFARLDPSYLGKGLTRGNRLEEEIWQGFVDDRSRLHETCIAIRALAKLPDLPLAPNYDDEGEEAATEGRLLYRLHRSRERSSSLVRKKKELALSQTGRLICEVCDFDFQDTTA